MANPLLIKRFFSFKHYKGYHYFIKSVLAFLLVIFCSVNAYSAGISVVPVQDKQSPVFSIQLDEAKILAGIKVSIEYSKGHFSYLETKKGTRLHSFMHVVNDKVPGQLVVVMASAKGISGKDITLFKVRFSSETRANTPLILPTVTTCELMSEELAAIPCNIKPAAPGAPVTDDKSSL